MDRIRPLILVIRKRRVMLDAQLAALYGVKAIRLREQVRRDKERFPEDFMFQLTAEEAEALVSQNGYLRENPWEDTCPLCSLRRASPCSRAS